MENLSLFLPQTSTRKQLWVFKDKSMKLGIIATCFSLLDVSEYHITINYVYWKTSSKEK